MKKFEFTNEEVEVLKTRAGMMALLTDDDVEKLKKGEADEHTVYWVEKKLSYWRQQKRAEEKQQERQMRQPITRIELLNFAGQHLVTKQSLKEVVLRQEAVIRLIGERFGKSSAENWFTDENIVKASHEIIVESLPDICGGCSLNSACLKEKAVLAKVRFPLVDEKYANKVCSCSEFKAESSITG